MVRVPTDVSAALRARWLAELTEALEEAQALIWRLGVAEIASLDTLDLLARLEAARAEVRSLKFMRLLEPSGELDPEWTSPVPWDKPQTETCA